MMTLMNKKEIAKKFNEIEWKISRLKDDTRFVVQSYLGEALLKEVILKILDHLGLVLDIQLNQPTTIVLKKKEEE